MTRKSIIEAGLVVTATAALVLSGGAAHAKLVAKQSAPVAQQSAPVAKKSAPVAKKSAPVAKRSNGNSYGNTKNADKGKSGQHNKHRS